MTDYNKKFPTLYKKTATGALQEWTIVAHEGCYYTLYGQTGGKITRSEDTCAEGKSEGRANETTCFEQALLEAEALWTKKLKKDYARDRGLTGTQRVPRFPVALRVQEETA